MNTDNILKEINDSLDSINTTLESFSPLLKDIDDKEKDILNLIDNQKSSRWLAIAKTDIEKGFMALRRAVCSNE